MDIKFNNELIYVKGKYIDYIQFKKLLDLGIMNAYTLRNDNFNFKYVDENDYSNFDVLSKEFNIDKKKIRIPVQVHSETIKIVNNETKLTELENTDGLITKEQGIALVTRNADCILFVLYDKKNDIIANVHSGWRGTFKKIVEKTIIKMEQEFKTNPEDLIICISPSIRKDHFEVEEDVASECKKIFAYTNKIEDFIIKKNEQKYLIDTVAINKWILNKHGVKSENIIDSNLCSVCNNNFLCSYRKEGKSSNRNAFIIEKTN